MPTLRLIGRCRDGACSLPLFSACQPIHPSIPPPSTWTSCCSYPYLARANGAKSSRPAMRLARRRPILKHWPPAKLVQCSLEQVLGAGRDTGACKPQVPGPNPAHISVTCTSSPSASPCVCTVTAAIGTTGRRLLVTVKTRSYTTAEDTVRDHRTCREAQLR